MSEPTPSDLAKESAARAAVAMVEDGMRLGLGSGSTAAVMVRHLAHRVRDEGLRLRCAASSVSTGELAQALGISIEPLDQIGWLDMTIDGADEIDPDLNLIKGGGGALLREKIVASASDRMVVIADASKLVDCLGLFHLPVEVIPFGAQTTRTLICRILEEEIGERPVLLRHHLDQPYRTDEGNLIFDLALERIPHPKRLSSRLNDLPGVVENGLFLDMCRMAIIGQPGGEATQLTRDLDEDGQA